MSWTLTTKLDFHLQVQARSLEEEGGAGPPRQPRRDQEQGGEARSSESWTSFASAVPQQQCYGHCPCDSAPHSS